VRWHEPLVTLRLSDGVRSHFGNESEEALLAASEAWLESPEAPVFQVITDTSSDQADPEDGINGVYLADEWVYEEGRLAVTLTTFRTDTGQLQDADVVLNPNYFPEAENRYDLGRVFSHELGHVLGLGESDIANATMWPAIPGGARLRPVAEDDLDGLLAIYGRRNYSVTLCSSTSGHGRPIAPLALLLIGTILRQRRRR
jgi:MYXO-CTERM domain-containing protein